MRFDAVIFDIDNVLIDTRASYTDCIRKTVETYLEKILTFQPSRSPLITRRDVEIFKSLGGFNDDWDTCYGLLLYFLSLKIGKRSISELAKQKDIPRLIQKIKQNILPPSYPPPKMGGGIRWGVIGVDGLERICGKQKSVSLKQIADIFQRFYLNDFVWNEKLMISKSLLKQLKRAGLKLGIVTGRSRDEAGFALRRFQIDSFFSAVVTADDTPNHFKKPHPYGLLKVAAKLGKNLRYLYVGDLPDDILAARSAKKKMKIASCGFLAASSSPREMKQGLKKSKADYICEQPNELIKIILPTGRSI
ncbi:MAG: HAD-IA family hydrolase [Candidatus Omnitrophica bacterium]|nr:HAD-IA family hydrolase [Candidatus Omnitrophota bacterium]